MSEITPNSNTPTNDPTLPPTPPSQLPPASAPPAPKRKRRWLALLGVLLVLIILLIALAPTIAGLGFVRSIVVSKVNDNLNGSVEIGNYSVGWTGGISANDVKIYDAQKNLILQLNKFSTSLSLLNAAKGNFALGDTTVDVDLVRAEVDENGQLNYAKLLKQEAKSESKKTSKDENSKPSPLPEISGNLTVNYKGTIYQGGNALVQIQPSTATVQIPGINQPISNDVTLKYTVNNGSVATVHVVGSASAVKNNQLDLDHASADEKLELADVDLKAISPILELLSPSLKLKTDGIASGSLAIKADGTNSLTAGGNFDVSKFDISGAPLKGNDRLAIDQITVPIDISRTMKNGEPFIEVKHADVLLNGGILGKITVTASAPQGVLLSAAALVPAVMERALLGKEPAGEALTISGEGSAAIIAHFDVATIASQLPNTIGLQKGTTLTQGHLDHQTTIAISKDTAKIATDTKLPDLQGTSDGKPVQLSPIEMSAGLSAVGGSAPDLHDLSIHFTSAFLNASGGGATLSQENLTVTFDLAKLQSQAAQFVDLDALVNEPAKSNTAPAANVPAAHVQLAGAGTFDLNTDGDLIKTDGQSKVATSLTITGINASGIATLPPVKLTNFTAALNGDLHRGAAAIDYKKFAASLTATGLTVAGTSPSAPSILDNETISADVNGDASLSTGENAKLINLSALSLKSSSNLFGIVASSNTPDAVTISADKGIVKANGSVTVNADLQKLNELSQRFSPASKTTASTGNAGQLQSGQLTGKLSFTRGNDPQTDISFDGSIANLTVTTAQRPITNETIKLALHAVNSDIGAPLKADASLDSRFMTAKLSNASVKLAGSPGVWEMLQQADVDLNIPDLPAVYEILNAFSPAASAQASAILPNLATPHRNVLVPSGSASFTDSAPLSLAASHRFIQTLDPASPDTETPEEAARRRKREKKEKAAKSAAAPAETPIAPLAPLQITSGSANGKITIHRDTPSQTTTLNVSDFSISKLALARGEGKYIFARNVDLKLAIAVKAANDPAKPALIDQIQEVQVTQLDGDLAIGKVTMPQPIVLRNLSDPNQINAHGTIKVDGVLTDATPLLAILEGADKPMPYGGTYDVSQVIRSGTTTQGKLLNLVGNIDITNFRVFDDSGKPVYTEPTVAIKNNLDYIIAATPETNSGAAPTTSPSARSVRSGDQAIVRSLTVDMPSSHALAINFVGRVADPFNKRVIRGVGTDPTAKLDLTYDLAKLWPIIKPTLAPDMQEKYKNLKVVGIEHRTFNLSGYFPMAKTMAESMHRLNADGGFALDELDLPQGLTITKLDLPFKMTNGVVQTLPSAAPQTIGADTTQPITANTAICNQGAVDLSEMTLDMGQPSPVLGIAKNHKLLQSVRVNPVLADSVGAGNVLFKDATQANGLLDVTIVECDRVPLGDLLARRNDANATIIYSISDLSIDGPAPQILSGVLPLGGQGLHGGIQDGKLTLANGEVNNDFSLNIVRYTNPSATGQPVSGDTSSATPTDTSGSQLVPVNLPMKFSGGVSLATGALKNFLVNIPSGLLPAKWASLFPNGLAVPFTGNSGHPQFDIAKAVAQNALGGGSSGGNPTDLLKGFLKKKKKAPAPTDSQD